MKKTKEEANAQSAGAAPKKKPRASARKNKKSPKAIAAAEERKRQRRAEGAVDDGRKFSKDYQPSIPNYPSFDYDSDEFYDEIFAAAFQGMTNVEIADAVGEKLHFSLSSDYFNHMIIGKCPNWTAEENERRGQRIKQVLARGRRKTNALVRGRFLKAALGGIKTKNVTTVTRRLRIDGEYTDDQEIQTSVTEFESSPNLQALSTWLHHHDPEWRKYEGHVEEDDIDDPNAIPTDIDHGIDIAAWVDAEVRDKEAIEKHRKEKAEKQQTTE